MVARGFSPWRRSPGRFAARRADEPSSVRLVLTDDHRTRELWPYHFRTELTVTIDEKSLQVKLDAFNTGDEPFSFTAALHTYLAVADIRETAIRGFTGKWYLDKTQGGNETKDSVQSCPAGWMCTVSLMARRPGCERRASWRRRSGSSASPS